MRGLGLLALLGSITLATTASAQADNAGNADDEVGRNLFQAGKVAYDAGNYEDALRYFEDSHARSQRPQLLYNIGQAADRLRNDDKAIAAFRAYLNALPNAENRAEVENRIRALERNQGARSAPTPAETAQASSLSTTQSDDLRTSADASKPVTQQWWFWTAIGGAVAAGVIIAVVASSGDTRQPPLDGSTGVTVMTLGGTR